jgi:hypothetical protein
VQLRPLSPRVATVLVALFGGVVGGLINRYLAHNSWGAAAVFGACMFVFLLAYDRWQRTRRRNT